MKFYKPFVSPFLSLAFTISKHHLDILLFLPKEAVMVKKKERKKKEKRWETLQYSPRADRLDTFRAEQ